jgi:proline-specific peptidase
MKKILYLIVLVVSIQSCQDIAIKRETVLDNISFIEDSIHYDIPVLPRLCDEFKGEKQFVDIGDCKLYCEIEGEGIPLALINGGPGGTHHCFHPWFSRAKQYCKVIYYDQRGCGQSDFEKADGYSFRQAVDDLEKLRQKLGIEQWIVCGYSYGGALAQYYTTTYSENVLGLVLIGSATLLQDELLNGTRQYDYISEEESDKINEMYALHNKGELNLTQLLVNKNLNGDWKRQNYYKPTKEEFIRGALYEWVNDDGFNRTMGNSYGKFDFKHVFDNCPVPTLICEGKWDLTWSENKAQIFKQNHPNAQFVMFENSGHSIYCDEPELFFSTLKEFAINLSPAPEENLNKWKMQAGKIINPQEILFENEQAYFRMIDEQGVKKAMEYYFSFKQENQGKFLFTENGMNNLGYTYLGKKAYEEAINIFEMNVDAYPDSWNVYDSLGEAYLKNWNIEKAKENYNKSITLNPENENGKKVLKELI